MQRFTATIEFDAQDSGIAMILFSLMNEAFANQPASETVPVFAKLDRIINEGNGHLRYTRAEPVTSEAFLTVEVSHSPQPKTCDHCRRVAEGKQSCCPFHY